jgi:hypothetical protein
MAGLWTLGFFEPSRMTLSPTAERAAWEQRKPPLEKLRSGDLVFRMGRGFISHSMRQFSLKEPRYSHAGILALEANKVFVYHCIGGEDNPESELRKDLFESFCSPELAHSFGVFRLPVDAASGERIVCKADSLFKKRVLFDEQFDLSTDEKMYCTEFVYKTIKSLVSEKIPLSSSEVSGKKYIACDDLFLIPNTKLIYQTTY